MNDIHQEVMARRALERVADGGRLATSAVDQNSMSPIVTSIMSALRRRWRVIAIIVAASLVVGILATMLMTPMYTAKATIDIRRENSGLVNVRDDDGRTAVIDQEFYETQYGLLKARSLAAKVATSLRLQDNAHFFEVFGAGKTWFANGRIQPGASKREDRVGAATDILLSHIALDHERQSRLVEVKFTSPDPVLSKRVADAWGRQFIQMTLEQRFSATSFARKFLESRLEQLRRRIDESERKVVDYASRENLVNLPGTSGTATTPGQPERSLVADDLAAFNTQLAQATADKILAESRASQGGLTLESVQNATLVGLRQQRAQFSADYAKLMTQFEPDYPPAKSLNNQIRQLDISIAREESRVSGSLQQTVQAARAREADLRQRVNALSGNVLDSRRRSIQYNIYLRDADTNRQLYDALLQRYKEIGVAGGVAENNISIVDDSELPRSPSSPILPLNLAIALLAGMLLGGAIAWILEQVDEGIVDPSEVEAQLGVPLLGTIPKVLGNEPIFKMLHDRKSLTNEAYTSVQASLSFATDHGIPRTVAVTSTRPAEGKSTTAYALALSLARTQRRVLLVDADMRSPSVHKLMDIDNVHGLSNYLSGNEKLAALVRPTAFEGLEVMTAGPHPPSSPELLSGERFEMLLRDVLQNYDHLVLDAPPVMGLADAPIIGSKVESVVYILEAHGTRKRMARIAMDRLRDAKSNVIGAILTKFDSRRGHYGYDYGYGYSYGDGDSRENRAA